MANLEAKLGDDEKNVHELRVGFSTDDTDMQLGESANSFAYAGSAKKGTRVYFLLQCKPLNVITLQGPIYERLIGKFRRLLFSLFG